MTTKVLVIDFSIEYNTFLQDNILEDVLLIEEEETIDISSNTSLLSDDISWNTITHLSFIYNNSDFFPFNIDSSNGLHYFGNDFHSVLDTIYHSIQGPLIIDFITTKFSFIAVDDLNLFVSLYGNKIHFRYPDVDNENFSGVWKLKNTNINDYDFVDLKLIYFDDDILNYSIELFDNSNKLYLKYRPDSYIDTSGNVSSINDIVYKEYNYEMKQSDIFVKTIESMNYKNIQQNLQNVINISYNSKAVASVNNDFTVSVWGDPAYGGNINDLDYGVSGETLENIIKVVSNERAFAAITVYGNIITWGDPAYGGDLYDISYGGFSIDDIFSYTYVDLFATSSAFAAIDVSGKVITWGDPINGGNIYSINGVANSVLDLDVKYVFSNPYAFVAIKNNDDIITWGNNDYGGTINNETLVNESLLEVSLFDILDGSFQMPLMDFNESKRNSFATSVKYVTTENKVYVSITDFDNSNNGCVKVFQYNDVSFVEISNNILYSRNMDVSFNNFGIQIVTSNNSKTTVLSRPLFYSNNYIESFQYLDFLNSWQPILFDISGVTASKWEYDNIDNITMSSDGNVIALSDISSSKIFTFHYDTYSNTYKHNENNEIFDASFSLFDNSFGEIIQLNSTGDIMAVSSTSELFCGVILIYFYNSTNNTWTRSNSVISDVDINIIDYNKTDYDGVGHVFSLNEDGTYIAYTNIKYNTIYIYDINKDLYDIELSDIDVINTSTNTVRDVLKLYDNNKIHLYTFSDEFGILKEYKYTDGTYFKSWGTITTYVDVFDISNGVITQNVHIDIYKNQLLTVIDNNVFFYSLSNTIPPKTKTVFSNGYSFALLDYSNNLYCWGHPIYGGRTDIIENVYNVVSSERAYCALLHDASMNIGTDILSWGLAEYGGDMYHENYGFKYVENGMVKTAIESIDISSVGPFKNIVSNKYAFVAHTYDNKIYNWGYNDYGGNIYDLSYGITTINDNYTVPDIIAINSTETCFIAMDTSYITHIWGKNENSPSFKTYFLRTFDDVSFSNVLNESGNTIEEIQLTIHNHVVSFVFDVSNVVHRFRNILIEDSMFSKDLFELNSTYGSYPNFTFLFNDGDVFFGQFNVDDNVTFQLLDISHCTNITYYEETFERPITFLLETSFNNINELFVYLPYENINDIHKVPLNDIKFIFTSETAYLAVTNNNKLLYNPEPHNYNPDFTNREIYNVYIDSILASNLNFMLIDLVSERFIKFDPYRTENLYVLEDLHNTITNKTIENVIEYFCFNTFGIFHVDVSYNNTSYETILSYNILTNNIIHYDSVFNDTNQIVNIHKCGNEHFTIETQNNTFYVFEPSLDTSFNVHNIPEPIQVFTSHYDDTYFGLGNTTLYFWKGDNDPYTSQDIQIDFTVQDISNHQIYHRYKENDALSNVYKIAFLLNNHTVKILGNTTYNDILGDYTIETNGDISGIELNNVSNIFTVNQFIVCQDVSNVFTILCDTSFNETGYIDFTGEYYHIMNHNHTNAMIRTLTHTLFIHNLEISRIFHSVSDISYAIGDDILLAVTVDDVPVFIDMNNEIVHSINNITFASRIFQINSRAFIIESLFDYVDADNQDVRVLNYYTLRIDNTEPSSFSVTINILNISLIDFVINYDDYLLVSCEDNTVHYFFVILNSIKHEYVHIYNLDDTKYASNIVIKKDENDVYFAFDPFINQNTRYVANINYTDLYGGTDIRKYNVGNNFLFSYVSLSTGALNIYHYNTLNNISLHHNDFAIEFIDDNFSIKNIYVNKSDFIIETSDYVYIFNSNGERSVFDIEIVVDTVYVSDYCFFLVASEIDSIISWDYYSEPKYFNFKIAYYKIKNVTTLGKTCAIITIENNLYIYDKNDGLIWSDEYVASIQKNKYYYIYITSNNRLKLFDVNKNKLFGTYDVIEDINVPNTYKHITSEKCAMVYDNSGNIFVVGDNASLLIDDFTTLPNMSATAAYDSLYINYRKKTGFYNLPNAFLIDVQQKTMILTRNIEYDEIEDGATIFLEDGYTFDGLNYSIDFDYYSTDGIFERVSNNIFKTSPIYIQNLMISNGDINDNGGGFVKKDSFGFKIKDCISHNMITNFGSGMFFGANCYDCSIVGSYSSGDISNNSGGIFGHSSYHCDVSACYTLGTITYYSGGIFGPNSVRCLIYASYANGDAYEYSGAMFGTSSFNSEVFNSFSRSILDNTSHGVCGVSCESITSINYYSFINEEMDTYYENNFQNSLTYYDISNIRFDNSSNVLLNTVSSTYTISNEELTANIFIENFLYFETQETKDTVVLKYFTQPPWDPGFYKINNTQAFFDTNTIDNYSGFTFRYLDISGFDFTTYKFDLSNFYKCNIVDCSFISSSFELTVFEECNIENCKIDDTTFFQDTVMTNTTSSGIDISNTSNVFNSYPRLFVKYGTIYATGVSHAKTSFNGKTFNNVVFPQQTNFEKVTMINTTFINCVFKYTNFQNVFMSTTTRFINSYFTYVSSNELYLTDLSDNSLTYDTLYRYIDDIDMSASVFNNSPDDYINSPYMTIIDGHLIMRGMKYSNEITISNRTITLKKPIFDISYYSNDVNTSDLFIEEINTYIDNIPTYFVNIIFENCSFDGNSEDYNNIVVDTLFPNNLSVEFIDCSFSKLQSKDCNFVIENNEDGFMYAYDSLDDFNEGRGLYVRNSKLIGGNIDLSGLDLTLLINDTDVDTTTTTTTELSILDISNVIISGNLYNVVINDRVNLSNAIINVPSIETRLLNIDGQLYNSYNTFPAYPNYVVYDGNIIGNYMDLSGYDFQDLNLSNVVLNGCNLNNVIFNHETYIVNTTFLFVDSESNIIYDNSMNPFTSDSTFPSYPFSVVFNGHLYAQGVTLSQQLIDDYYNAGNSFKYLNLSDCNLSDINFQNIDLSGLIINNNTDLTNTRYSRETGDYNIYEIDGRFFNSDEFFPSYPQIRVVNGKIQGPGCKITFNR